MIIHMQADDKYIKYKLKAHFSKCQIVDYKCYNHETQRNRKQKLYCMYCGFDIETTKNYMYIWQLSLFNESAEIVVTGRTWSELQHIMTLLCEICAKTSLIIGIHNLKFEFQWLRSRLKIDKCFMSDKREPYYISTNTQHAEIRFIDTMKFYNNSLEKVAKMINCEDKKTGQLDYSKMRNSKTPLTAEEIEYCIYDVVICSRIMQKIFNDEIVQYNYIPVSQTAIIRHTINEKAKDKKYTALRKRIESCKLSHELYYRLRGEKSANKMSFFEGGFTHANPQHANQIHENIYHFDYTSSYPYVMLTKLYPYEIVSVEPKLYEYKQIDENHAIDYILDIELINVKPLKKCGVFSSSRCQHRNAIIDNGKIYCADSVRTLKTAKELETYRKWYTWDTEIVHNSYKCFLEHLPDYVTDTIKEAYKLKNDLKKSGQTENPLYLKSKQLINGIYGMSVTEIKLKEYKMSAGDFDEIQNALESINNVSEVFQKEKRKPLLQQWGMFVTMYARCRLLEDLARLDDKYVYCDTDSGFFKYDESFIKYMNSENKRIIAENETKFDKSLSDIGTFTIEETSEKFKTCGAKKYVEYRNNEYYFTVAGIAKNTLKKYCKDNNISPFDVIEKSYLDEYTAEKLRPIFYDNETSAYITDEYGNSETMHEYTSQELVAVHWQASITQDYLRLIAELDINKKTKH